jgi:uncharacterized protein (DUF2236 family)
MRRMAIVSRSELEVALAELTAGVRNPHDGILGPTSIAWHLGGDLAVFLGGGRAALLQLAHPAVAYAVDQHSATRADVVGRFQRTFRNVFAMVFGELDDALFAARRVHQVHTRIHGEIPIDIGAWRAGTPYDANDTDALRWVHATLTDTTIAVRERLDGELPIAVKDAYTIEMNRFARLFGIPHALLPQSWGDHAAYMRGMIPQLAVAPPAREMAAFLIGRASPAQPALGRVAEATTVELLPPRLAGEFGLRRSRISDVAVRAAIATMSPVYRRLPARVVAIPARLAAERRLAGLPPSKRIARIEERLYALSSRVTGL